MNSVFCHSLVCNFPEQQCCWSPETLVGEEGEAGFEQAG